jgi:hypothetical protein
VRQMVLVAGVFQRHPAVCWDCVWRVRHSGMKWRFSTDQATLYMVAELLWAAGLRSTGRSVRCIDYVISYAQL